MRFEHCMALDARTDVKSQIRQRCWIEWVAFYTYGQTRDRVIHAQLRIKQLSGVSGFVGGPEHSDSGPLTTPAPTSALAAPPRMTNHATADSVSSLPAPIGSGGHSCAGECKTRREDCGRDCGTTSCRKACSTSFNSCMDACG